MVNKKSTRKEIINEILHLTLIEEKNVKMLYRIRNYMTN